MAPEAQVRQRCRAIIKGAPVGPLRRNSRNKLRRAIWTLDQHHSFQWNQIPASQDDMVLPKLQNQQRREDGLLQVMQSALVSGMDAAKAQISQQKRQECRGAIGLQRQRVAEEPIRSCVGVECLSKQCPLDTFYTYEQDCQQEIGHAGWSWCKGTVRADGGSTGLSGVGRGFFDSGGTEDSPTSERPEGDEYAIAGWDAGTVGTTAEQGTGNAYTWASEQAHQAKDPGIYCG